MCVLFVKKNKDKEGVQNLHFQKVTLLNVQYICRIRTCLACDVKGPPEDDDEALQVVAEGGISPPTKGDKHKSLNKSLYLVWWDKDNSLVCQIVIGPQMGDFLKKDLQDFRL